MNEVAICLFGTTGGVKAAIVPEGFPLPDPLYQVVDASLPFIWGKEVYRWQTFEVSADKGGPQAIVHFFAIYTKIDDLGGPRDGAFAGAGILIKDGHCDCELIAATLRKLLVYLIKETSNGRQFSALLTQQFPRLYSTMQSAAEKLADSYVAGGVLRPRRRPAQRRAVCTNEQWFLVSPAHFFEAARVSSSANYTDLYFSVDREFIQALSDYPDIAHVEPSSELLNTAAMAERRIAQTHQEYRKKLGEERDGRVAVESRYRELETSFQDSVSAALQVAENGLREELALARDLASLNKGLVERLQENIYRYERDNAGLTKKLENQWHDNAKQVEALRVEIDKLNRKLNARTSSDHSHAERQLQSIDPSAQVSSTPRSTFFSELVRPIISGVLVVLILVSLLSVAVWYFVFRSGPIEMPSLGVISPLPAPTLPAGPTSAVAGVQLASAPIAQPKQVEIDRERLLKLEEYAKSRVGELFQRKIPKNTRVSLFIIREEMVGNCNSVNARKFINSLTVADLHNLLSAFNPADQWLISTLGAEGEIFSEVGNLNIAYRLPTECKLPR